MNTNDQNQNATQDAVRTTAGRGSRAALYTSIGAAGLGAAGLVTALVIGLAGSGASANAGTAPHHRETHSYVAPIVVPVPTPSENGTGGATGGGSVTPVQPSPTIRLLQQQLGQLNYYEGPINGIDSSAVHQAIEYLQRDAHLPQNGVLTPATQSALSRMLATGNNQMGD
jgi:hypothetical protein